MGARPAHWLSASCFSEQRLPRCRWSISKAFGSVSESDFRFASPGRVYRSISRCGLADRRALFGPPTWRIVILGRNPRVAQLTAWKYELKSVTVPWSPIPWESTPNGEQFVGLMVKFGRSMLTWIERIRIGTPPMIDGIA